MNTPLPAASLPGTARQRRHPLPWLVIASVGLALGAAFAALRARPGDPNVTGDAPPTDSRDGGDETDAAVAAPPARLPARTDAGLPRTPSDAVEAPPSTFDEFVDRIVATGLRTMALAGSGDDAGATASDDAARALFADLMQSVAEADAAALAALCSEAAVTAASPMPARMRQLVLERTLAEGLRRRHDAAAASPAGAAVPAPDTVVAAAPATASAAAANTPDLVAGMLTAIPRDADLAHRLGGMLADRPYLALRHEPLVLDLVAMSGEGKVPIEVATALVATLWHNLRATGERTSEQLAGLALVMLEDGSPGARIAAGRLLLGDDRFRLVVLDHLRRSKDRQLAHQLAVAAAQDLPPATAFSVLTATAEIDGDDFGSFLLLGHRDTGLLQREYEQRLASDVEPRLRELLVAGAGFARTPAGLELARLALQSDPDPDVRVRAVFVLTGTAAATLGETAVDTALDDERIAGDPQRVNAVVLALQNLARAGQINALERLSRRLRACAGLDAPARSNLERILAESLPGGGQGDR